MNKLEEAVKEYLSNFELPFKYYKFGDETYRDIPKLFIGCIDFVKTTHPLNLEIEQLRKERDEAIEKMERIKSGDAWNTLCSEYKSQLGEIEQLTKRA